ncbi:hypothetical protein ACIPRL_11320 [Streptomyces sp. NPDC090085]|uniref:hypothetical protein n=1 Tax=Streptomyces sp. NPDC090085 TaxID=3365943 RepID=UPI003808F346
MNADQRPEPVERAALLAQLPAPAERDLPAGRHALHRELLMSHIDLTPPATRAEGPPAGPRLRRRLAFSVVGALAAGAAVGGVVLYDQATAGPLNSSELAGWTARPTPVDISKGRGASTVKWCLEGMPDDGGPTTVTNADLRGKVASMVVSRGGTTVLCYVTSNNKGLSMVTDSAQTVAHDAITYDTGGSHGSGSATFNYASGFVGSGVKAVSLTVQDRTFEVTVEKGRWTAWWPGKAPVGKEGLLDTATLTLDDGTTRTVSGSSMFRR